jgi:hypothetical protein
MDDSAFNEFQRYIEVRLEAEGLIGKRAWALLSSYGRLMGGPHTGLYVSGVPFVVQLDIVRRLVRGEAVPVHLMHRHRSGHYESSWLRWSQGVGFVMLFRDREEKA